MCLPNRIYNFSSGSNIGKVRVVACLSACVLVVSGLTVSWLVVCMLTMCVLAVW